MTPPPLDIDNINTPTLSAAGVKLDLLRLDQVHSTVSGNKWYKLKYNLQAAQEQGHRTLLTFGGAFSNHIYATAAAGKAQGLRTIGIIRGEEHLPLNPTLVFAKAQGMQLVYVSRKVYRSKNEKEFADWLSSQFGKCFIIPEGGSNALAVRGCQEILPLQHSYDYIVCCAGTGGTLAGLLTSQHDKSQMLGFSALKGGSFLYDEVDRLTTEYCGEAYKNYKIIEDYHFGGYAKANVGLVEFINKFKQEHGITLDPIYTGKMMYGLSDMIATGYFAKGSQVLAIHSGGLQGIQGFNQRFKARGWVIR